MKRIHAYGAGYAWYLETGGLFKNCLLVCHCYDVSARLSPKIVLYELYS